MSADIAYRLLVDMSTKGNLTPQLDKVGAKAKGVDDSLKKIGPSFSSSIGSAAASIERLGDAAIGALAGAAKWAAAGAAAGAAYGVHLNEELEKSKLSLGAIFTAQGITDGMGKGLELASTTIKEMRKDAAMLPGEFSDLLSFFKLGATPAFNIGASTKDLEKLSANAMAAAAATGVQMDQAAREFAQLLQGRAGAHNVFGSMLGLRAENFNHLSGEERLKALSTALGKYEGSIAEYGKSFDALSSTMRDNAKETLRKATEPLFNRMKEQLSLANTWFDKNQEGVTAFADKVGVQLEHGFDVARRKIYEWTPAIRSFAANARVELDKIWSGASPMLGKIERAMQAALASPKLFSHLETGAKIYGAAKIGRIASPAIGALVEGLGVGGITAFGAAIPEVAVGAAAAAPLIIAAAGAIHALTDATSLYHDQAVASVANMTKNLGKSSEHLANVADKTAPFLTRIGDALGTVLLFHLEGMSFQIEYASRMASKAADIFSRLGTTLGLWELPDPAKKAGKTLDQILARPEDEWHSRRHFDDDETGKKTKKGAGGGGGGTSIQKVEIVVSTNQDPSRIARLTVDRLQDISRFPTSSSRVRNWSAERP